jgi:hypothetical protein
MRSLILAALMLIAAGPAASAAPWRIVRDHWSEADERGFEAFVSSVGASSCSSSESCLRSDANPWRGTDGAFADIDVDCAKLPYLLRGYYAWKNGLPFAYADGVRGERFSKAGNQVISRTDIIDRGNGIVANLALRTMLDNVFSGSYRIDAGSTQGLPSDFYSPALQPGSIRPGSVIYDPNGHVGIVWKVDGAGRIFYMDAHPDFTISRSVYGAQFGQSPMRLGGGLKNWRPLRLIGARMQNGALVGGHIQMTRQQDIPDFSLAQYLGTEPNPSGDVAQARFTYKSAPLGFYEYVRAAISGGRSDFNPIYELQGTMKTLCNDLNDRAQAVNQAIANGVAIKNHPTRIPDNIYMSDNPEWEAYATPARDARLRAAFVQFHQDIAKMIGLWVNRDTRIVYDGQFLKQDLLKAYDAQSDACVINYLSGDMHPVAMTFDGMVQHLLAMSFDPYNCEELRWGDVGASSCADDATKQLWYANEAPMRVEIGREYGGESAGEGNPAMHPITQADVDIRGLIAVMPERVPFVQRYPQ